MKPIDGHAMIARVEALYRRGAVDMSYYNIVKEAVQMEPMLEIVRTSDRVNVTSCRDCKFYHGVNEECGCNGGYHSEDWYCADGERRDDDATLD